MLTPHQRQCLHVLHRLITEAEGVGPSYDELRRALGLASKSGVNRLLVALEERGFISRLAYRPRAIELTPKAHQLLGIAPPPLALPAPAPAERPSLETMFREAIKADGLQAVWQAFERARTTPAPYEAI